jgi:branched-chain amino acid transport system permease protein
MPFALISPYWDSITITALIEAVIVIGLYVSNSAGALSVAHAALAGMGGYLGAVLTTNDHWAFIPAILAGGAIGFAAGIGLAVVTLRMNPLVAGLTTLAFGETMEVVALNVPALGGATGFYGVPPLTTELNSAIVLALVMFFAWGFERSRLGLGARAIRDNAPAAAAMGVNVTMTKVWVFALGAGVAGVGGVLNIHYVLVQQPAALNFESSLPLVIMWVFGGSYTFWGAVFGAVILTFLPEVLRFSSEDRFMLYGILLAVFVIVRPTGVISRVPTGSRSRTADWLLARRGRPTGRDEEVVAADGSERSGDEVAAARDEVQT